MDDASSTHQPSNGRSSFSAGNGVGSGKKPKKRRQYFGADNSSNMAKDDRAARAAGVSSSSRPAAAAASASSERRADRHTNSTGDTTTATLALSSSPRIPKKKRKAPHQDPFADHSAPDMYTSKSATKKDTKKKKRKLVAAEAEINGGRPTPSASSPTSPSRARAAAQAGNNSLSAVEMALARLEARSAGRQIPRSPPNTASDKKAKAKTNPKSPLSAAQQSSSFPARDFPQDTTKVPTDKGNGVGDDIPKTNRSKKKKKKKRHSPFRVRVGCIVALRYQSDGAGNNTTSIVKRVGESDADNGNGASQAAFKTMEIWADPQPGRDDGLALIGRRIRCVFPGSMLPSAAVVDAGSATSSSRPTSPKLDSRSGSLRALEGEVVAILGRQMDGGGDDRASGSTTTTTVSLLIDQTMARQYAFLPIDPIASGTADSSGISDTEQKRMEMERVIRGEGKVAVQVPLADAGVNSGSGSKCGARWAIRKRVPVPAALTASSNGTPGDVPNTVYVGDGNDTEAQQQQNWRWLASSSASPALSSPASGPHADTLLGEVVKVEPSANPVAAGTLAVATVKRMWLPELTASGRLARHGPMEIFDDINAGWSRKDAVLYDVPIERLVIVGRHADRVTESERSADVEHDLPQHFQVVRRYSAADGRFMNTGANADDGISSAFCHRCRFQVEPGSMRTCCSGTCQPKQKSRWCKDCILHVESAALTIEKDNAGRIDATDDQNWIGPCCTGRCDCTTCLERACKSLSCAFLSWEICSICSKPCADGPVSCKKCLRTSHSECASWERALRHTFEVGYLPSDILQTDDDDGAATKIKCRSCRHRKKRKKAEKTQQKEKDSSELDCFKNLSSLLASNNPLDFDIPESFGAAGTDEISANPIVKIFKRKRAMPEKITVPVVDCAETRSPTITPKGKKRAKSPTTKRKRASPMPSPKGNLADRAQYQGSSNIAESTKVFKPTCSRTLQYDPTKKDLNALHTFDPLDDLNSRVHISRRRTDADDTNEPTAVVETKKAKGRAARASQRRMLRDVASFGASGFGVDSLAGRDKEQSIRFGRSGIHAWGVFADEKISKGDMIVEYRGVLISNRVCEKREKEYEKSKVGSDYMFRIDSEVVCDATYQGNVARFINASCDPNCFTKIVTIDGTKRIVIFAKRDIKPGEELVYNYMFPLEFDEKKRIPCHCGSSKCKGFMNWDNRYVVIPPKEKGGGEQEKEAGGEKEKEME